VGLSGTPVWRAASVTLSFPASYVSRGHSSLCYISNLVVPGIPSAMFRKKGGDGHY
jgi:hypothetical protein